MENNEIMTNEECTDVDETVEEETMKEDSGTFRTAAFGGLTVLIGGLAAQYIVKPIIAKIRARKKKSEGVIDRELTAVSGKAKNVSEEPCKDE